jgi:hypothetical protein
VLSILRNVFDNERTHARSHHEGYNGVKTHENGIFLYKSLQADSVLRTRITDYMMLFGLTGLVTGYNPLLICPVFVMALYYPRKLATLHYFTFHAELLPHTE